MDKIDLKHKLGEESFQQTLVLIFKKMILKTLFYQVKAQKMSLYQLKDKYSVRF